jgi:acetoin utilization deacetylase AcuC-like enzyme
MCATLIQAKLLAVSAGFDAAAGDELGECFVTPTGYAHMTHMLSGLAGGRLAVALEVKMAYIRFWFLFIRLFLGGL